MFVRLDCLCGTLLWKNENLNKENPTKFSKGGCAYVQCGTSTKNLNKELEQKRTFRIRWCHGSQLCEEKSFSDLKDLNTSNGCQTVFQLFLRPWWKILCITIHYVYRPLHDFSTSWNIGNNWSASLSLLKRTKDAMAILKYDPTTNIFVLWILHL